MKVIDRIYSSVFRYPVMFFMILLGGVFCGISFNVFLIPNNLLSGGVSGISLILSHLFGIDPGILIIVFNIPIFILGYRYVDREFIFLSMVGMVSFSLSITAFSFLRNMVFIDDVLLCCIFGGVMNGIGTGIVFRNRASQGGIDIIAVIVKKYFSMNLGTTSMMINLGIVVIASIFYGLKPALYTLISMYVASIVMDKVQQGFNIRKSVMIISDKETEVAEEIFKQLNRGVTFLEGEGAYTGSKKKVIYCIVSMSQVAKLKQIVKDADRDAFMSVSDTTEVLGLGFYSRGI